MDDAPTVFHSCIFRNNVLSLASDTGPQLIQAYNYTELDNCTITDTRTSPSGPLLQAQLFYVRGGNIVVNNSVIYNPGVTELYNFYVYSSNNTLQLNNSFVGTFPAFSQVIYTNCSNQNPQISLEAYPQSSSPVLTWNGPSPLSNDQLDTLLFPRLPGQNIGALGFTTDTTGNGLNAEWETKYFGATGQNASYIGASGLTYLQAYTYGTNPMVFSSSGDSISDYQKILNGFDPWTTDTAGDGVGDATKIKYGMSPTQDDRLGDLAYSGVPNLFQLIDGTNPTIPSQAPGPDIVVDQSGQTTGSYKTITLGLAAANNLSKQAVIIFVKPGNYQENVSIFLSNKVLLLKSTQGPYATSIQGTSGSIEMEVSTPAVIDGFSFVNPQGATTDLTNQSVLNGDGFENPQGLTTGQFPSNAYTTTTSTASRLGFALAVSTSAGIPSYPAPLTPVIKNCVFQSLQTTNSTIYENGWPGISLENVILSHCYTSPSGPILIAPNGNIALTYCTIYRNTPPAGYQIVGAQNVSVTTSVLYDPGYTEVTVAAPPAGSGSAIVTNAILYASSVTISPSDLSLEPHLLVEGTETLISSSRFMDPSPVGYDINHQSRAGDIGAYQWVDSLGKGIPDSWQLEHYGTLTADNGALSSGGSVLTDAQSFEFGLDPLYPNEFGVPNQNYADPSGDGLTYSQDISLGYNPEIPSNNGDGVINAIQPNVGLSPFNMNINGDGMTNAQNLAAGINPFLPYTPYSPPSTGATVPPTITLLMPVEAVPNQ